MAVSAAIETAANEELDASSPENRRSLAVKISYSWLVRLLVLVLDCQKKVKELASCTMSCTGVGRCTGVEHALSGAAGTHSPNSEGARSMTSSPRSHVRFHLDRANDGCNGDQKAEHIDCLRGRWIKFEIESTHEGAASAGVARTRQGGNSRRCGSSGSGGSGKSGSQGSPPAR